MGKGNELARRFPAWDRVARAETKRAVLPTAECPVPADLSACSATGNTQLRTTAYSYYPIEQGAPTPTWGLGAPRHDSVIIGRNYTCVRPIEIFYFV